MEMPLDLKVEKCLVETLSFSIFSHHVSFTIVPRNQLSPVLVAAGKCGVFGSGSCGPASWIWCRFETAD